MSGVVTTLRSWPMTPIESTVVEGIALRTVAGRKRLEDAERIPKGVVGFVRRRERRVALELATLTEEHGHLARIVDRVRARNGLPEDVHLAADVPARLWREVSS